MTERLGQDLLLLEKLAAGGMAEVFRARQLGYGGFEKTVAVKRILQHYASSEDFKEMFRQEANLSALLQHPNIAQIFANGEVEGYLYLVMEFVDGKNARQLLARADKKKLTIPIEISCFIVAEVARGLEYAHQFVDEKTGEKLDIVHRDMSPQNIMLSYDGAVKIVDFGIAKAAARADNTRAGVLKGKFGYMSPEQASGMKLDKRTDIFALGIILFELLTQRRLFASDDDLKTLNLVKECRVPRPSKYNPSVSPALDRIVMKALSKERADRYQNAGEFNADLQRLMNQRYAKFIPTEFGVFVRELFSEDIIEEKKRREKILAEAPMITAHSSQSKSKFTKEIPMSHTKSKMNDLDKTQVSGSTDEEESKSTEATSTEKSQVSTPNTNSNSLPKPLSSIFQENSIPASTLGVSRDTFTHSYAPTQAPRSRRSLLYSALALFLLFALWAKKNSERPMDGTPTPAEREETVQIPAQDSPSTAPAEVAEKERPPIVPEKISESTVEVPQEISEPSPLPKEIRKPASKKIVLGTRALKPPGFLNIESDPRATEIVINGEVLKESSGETLTTPLKRYSLPPGKYKIQLKNSGFGASWSGSVTIQSDRIVTQEAVLK